MSITSFILETPRTMESSDGRAPPHRDVPAPLAITLMPFSLQYLSTRETCSVVVGRTAASGICLYAVKASVSNALRPSSSEMTLPGGTRALRPRINSSRREITPVSGSRMASPVIFLCFLKWAAYRRTGPAPGPNRSTHITGGSLQPKQERSHYILIAAICAIS